MPAVQHRLVSWRPSLLLRMIGIPRPADDPELEKKLALDGCSRPRDRRQGRRQAGRPMTRTTRMTTSWSSTTMMMTRISSSSPPRKPPARWRRSTASSGRIWAIQEAAGLRQPSASLVETLFNVIMPLSLKFLIDDALGEEDFQALYKILGVLAVAGIITSIIAVWYERWDARLAACDHRRRAVAICSSTSRTCRRPILPAPSAAKFSRASRSTFRPSKARSRPSPTARRCRSWN